MSRLAGVQQPSASPFTVALVAHQDRSLRDKHGHDERGKKSHVHHVPIRRENQPELKHDDRDLCRLGPQHRSYCRHRSRRAIKRDHDGENNVSSNVDHATEKRGKHAVPSGQPSRDRCDQERRNPLPSGDASDGKAHGMIALSSSHRNHSKPANCKVFSRGASTKHVSMCRHPPESAHTIITSSLSLSAGSRFVACTPLTKNLMWRRIAPCSSTMRKRMPG